MSRDEIKSLLLRVAREAASVGPGWAQEGVVLRDVGEKLRMTGGGSLDRDTEQALLEAWHDLFVDKVLAWGYDLDNPGSPFFHVRKAS